MAAFERSSRGGIPEDDSFRLAAPQLALPKGGGSLRGIGEKFTANPVTGTASLTVPIATSPGRSGFAPALTVSYDSGSGNGPFGVGWSLSLPAITRKTDRGLPRYRDAEESDIFILSAAEDLTPAFKRNADGTLALDKQQNPVYDEETRDGYQIRRYRPRVEGLFARIERWRRLSDNDTHWRSISKENSLTVYGGTPESRIADPADPRRVFSWLICQSYDDKGNAVLYEYVAESGDSVDLSKINERNRIRSANRYLRSVRYGNRQPLLVEPSSPGFRRPYTAPPDSTGTDWMFEVVFDYGQGQYSESPPDADARIFAACQVTPPSNAKWPARLDPFSTYRPGFEVRGYRLCRRALLFHHFPGDLGVDDYLVRATEFDYQERANGSFLTQVKQSGFKRIGARYLKRSLPPVEFEYSTSPLDDLTHDRLSIHELDSASLENLPSGIDGRNYHWIDLDGEGISGVLTEDRDAWYYKRNLGAGRFAAVQQVLPRPSYSRLNRGRQQLLDLDADGTLDLVDFDSPSPGFFARTDDAGWEPFRGFESLPNVNWKNPNLRFVDLTGDGRADMLITEDEAYSMWHESYAEEGFGPAKHVDHPLQEGEGPRLVFADGTESVYLADMSGDGMSDLVRIRNGDVSYWPNLGYGRFGARVALNGAPWFDDAESFDHRRLHLVDTDGSGPTDIVYLGRDGARVYLNQHGNSLSEPRLLSRVPRTDSQTSVSVVDFLGRGTACLLWSSSSAHDAARPIRYVDLMGGVPPHLLVRVRNNLGAETKIEYACSTEFYLADKAAGTPWATRLPFPVQVVSKVETNDLISGNRFATTYTYHHGYFDSAEREFRGFGRVEQRDTEDFGVLPPGTPPTNRAPQFHAPPTLTKTWFHTGAYRKGERLTSQFKTEYYRESEQTEAMFAAMLLDDTVLPADLPPAERREAVRALKGAILRQEVFALDNTGESALPFSVTERSYSVKLIQPRGANLYAVFTTHSRESLDLLYDRKLFSVANGKVVDPALNPDATRRADPRVSHSATLAVDDYGNTLQSITIAYGRRFDDTDPLLTDADRKKQKQIFATLTEAVFTNPVTTADTWRAPLAAEFTTFEVLSIRPASQQPDTTNLFRFDELASLVAQMAGSSHDLRYEEAAPPGAGGAGPYRRPIERISTRYRANNLTQLLPARALESLALPGETYKLGFTPGLLAAVFQRPRPGQASENLLPNPIAVFPADPGQWSGRGGYVDLNADGHWWAPSGRVFFHPAPNTPAPAELAEAAGHFFLPRRFVDPFTQSTSVDYANDLLPIRTTDALGNIVEASQDFRVLQPKQLTDPNGNRAIGAFDALGLIVATAVCGKASESLGDSLDDFGDLDADPSLAQVQSFIAKPREQAAALLKQAATRIVYDFDRFQRCAQPPFSASLARETHAADPLPPGGLRIQISFSYSDGFGRNLQTKLPAEPGDAPVRVSNVVLPGGDIRPGPLTPSAHAPANPRWVGSGRTVYNNKGAPVKQYEPFFSSTHLYEPEADMTDSGVTSVLLYDAKGRLAATLFPNRSYAKAVFSPWRHENWDVNDTVTQAAPQDDPDVGALFKLLPGASYLPTWHDQRKSGLKGPDEQKAAAKAAAHAGTPAVTYFDSLGRSMVSVSDNGGGVKLASRVTLDIEGNQREVKDANNRVVARHTYDMLGGRIYQESMDAGARWVLTDAAGNPLRGWDSRGHMVRVESDELRRPRRSFATGALAADPAREICFDFTVYGESADTGLTAAQVLQGNLRGKTYKHYGLAGVSVAVAYDFKGNLLRSTRELVKDYKNPPDWSQSPLPELDPEVFTNSNRYDARSRPLQVIAPHKSADAVNILQPAYNEANLMQCLDVWLEQNAEPAALLPPSSADLHAVANIDYNAKGQRTRIDSGNGASTEYIYDEETSRLIHLKTARTGPETQSALDRLLGRTPAQITSVFQDLFYTYDPTGNITQVRDDAQQTLLFSGQAVPPASDYTYDAIYRLIEASGREHIGQQAAPQTSWDDRFRIRLPHPHDDAAMRNYTEQYFYDAAGNFEKLVHQATNGNWTRTFALNEASGIESGKKNNRLSSASVGAVTETYAYDAHGNMTGMPHLTVMQWDFKDQLSVTSRQAVNEDLSSGTESETTYYVYDSSGQRIRKVTERQGGARKEERLYLGGFEIYRRFTAAGDTVALERETLHLIDDRQHVAMVESRTIGNDGSPPQLIRFQFGNHLGSASLELDEAAKIISREEYYPFGSTSYQAADSRIRAAAKRFRFGGKERDEETGFSYHGARYYAPWLGRWTSCDPGGLIDGLNLYWYARDSPTVLADGNGQQAAKPQWQEVVVNDDPDADYAQLEGTDVTARATDKYTEIYHQEGGDQGIVFRNDKIRVVTPHKLIADATKLSRTEFYQKHKKDLTYSQLTAFLEAMPKPEYKLPEEDKNVYMGQDGLLGTADQIAERELADKIEHFDTGSATGGLFMMVGVAAGADQDTLQKLGKLGTGLSDIAISVGFTAGGIKARRANSGGGPSSARPSGGGGGSGAAPPPAPASPPAPTSRMADPAIIQHHTTNVYADFLVRAAETPGSYEAYQAMNPLMRMQFGNLMQPAVGESMARSPGSANLYLPIYQRPGQSVPDFLRIGDVGSGRPFVELTTMRPATVENHLQRWYGPYSDFALYPSLPGTINPQALRLQNWVNSRAQQPAP